MYLAFFGIHSHFFMVGGPSLAAVAAASNLHVIAGPAAVKVSICIL